MGCPTQSGTAVVATKLYGLGIVALVILMSILVFILDLKPGDSIGSMNTFTTNFLELVTQIDYADTESLEAPVCKAKGLFDQRSVEWSLDGLGISVWSSRWGRNRSCL